MALDYDACSKHFSFIGKEPSELKCLFEYIACVWVISINFITDLFHIVEILSYIIIYFISDIRFIFCVRS